MPALFNTRFGVDLASRLPTLPGTAVHLELVTGSLVTDANGIPHTGTLTGAHEHDVDPALSGPVYSSYVIGEQFDDCDLVPFAVVERLP